MQLTPEKITLMMSPELFVRLDLKLCLKFHKKAYIINLGVGETQGHLISEEGSCQVGLWEMKDLRG